MKKPPPWFCKTYGWVWVLLAFCPYSPIQAYAQAPQTQRSEALNTSDKAKAKAKAKTKAKIQRSKRARRAEQKRRAKRARRAKRQKKAKNKNPKQAPAIAPTNSAEPDLLLAIPTNPADAIDPNEPRLQAEPGITVLSLHQDSLFGSPDPSTQNTEAIPTKSSSDQGFLQVTFERNLRAEIVGPIVVAVEVRVHRDIRVPETLEPLAVAILMDETLVATHRLDPPPDGDKTILNTEYGISKIGTISVPIGADRHILTVAISDTAPLGASIRLRTQEVGHPLEDNSAPQPLQVASDPNKPVNILWDLAGTAGIWLTADIPDPGFLLEIEGRLRAPALSPHFAIALNMGVGRLGHSQSFVDPRRRTQSNRLSISALALPIRVELQGAWQWPLPNIKLLKHVALGGGVGGGFVAFWLRTSTPEAAFPSATATTGITAIHLDGMLGIGPGEILARVGYLWSPDVAGGGVGGLSAHGGHFALGYRWQPAPKPTNLPEQKAETLPQTPESASPLEAPHSYPEDDR